MQDTVCYLIGGAPRTGKTTMAEKLAAEYGIKSLSTDSIATLMTKFVCREDYPNLFYKQGLTPEEFYKKYDTPAEAVEAGVKAAYDTQRGVMALIEYTLPTRKVLVIEGVFITPDFVKRLQEKHPKISIYPTFLFDDNTQRIRERIYTKRLWSHKSYTERPQEIEKEIEYVMAYNEWFRNEATRYGFNITKVT